MLAPRLSLSVGWLRFPMLGAAILACELEGLLPWTAAHPTKLKSTTGKGNAKKPDMQAAAKARWSVDL